MKTFSEFLIEGRGFSWNGSDYSSGFGRYTKNGESISREEYLRASEAYKNKDGVKTNTSKNNKVDLTPKQIKSTDEVKTSEIKPIFSDIIPKEAVESSYSTISWGDFIKDDSKSFKLREYLSKLTGTKFNADEFYKWSDVTEYEDSKIGNGGKTLVQTIRKNVHREATLDKQLTELGIDPVDFKKRMNSAMKDYVKDGVICVRCSPTNLQKIIADGRFKTLFETKTSKGLSNISLRANVEAIGQGLSYKTKKKDRPVYGTLKHMIYDSMYAKDDEEVLDVGGDDAGYGTMCVVLKKDNVRERTKISFGDSLLENTISAPLDEPNYVSLLSYLVDGCKDLKEKYEQLKEDPYYAIDSCIGTLYAQYAEVQIHGGVTVDDIDHVVFRGYKFNAPEKCIETLNKAGIKFVLQEEF